tara:strand:- start:73 stop:477 length:405 start_codon:yes stop_codon:yes gene_type:complete
MFITLFPLAVLVAFGAVTVPALIVRVSPLASPRVVFPFKETDPLTFRIAALVVPVSVSALIVPPVVVPLRVKLPLNVPLAVGDTSVVFVPVPAFFNINDDDIDPMFAVDVQKSEDAPTESVDPSGLIFRVCVET